LRDRLSPLEYYDNVQSFCLFILDLTMMPFKSLLLFSTSVALALHSVSAIAVPVSMSQVGTSTPSAVNDIYETCQKNANAIVTLYSGTEIGTGSIVSPNGLLITNYHVVKEAIQAPSKTKIYVKLTNGTRYIGRAIKSDQPNDLAVVKLDTQAPLPVPVALAQPGNIRLGQEVCAIGNPFGLTSISVGKLKEFRGSNDLKSDIFLIRGNSGGPLLNEQGEMIGVNKSIWLSETGENTGISFSTTIGIAKKLIDDAQIYLERNPSQSSASAAPLSPSDSSLQIANRSVASGGVLGAIVDAKSLIIRQIVLGSPADMGGLRPGDRLLSGDRKPLKNLAALQAVLNRGQAILDFTVKRGQNNIPIRINFKQTTQQDRLK